MFYSKKKVLLVISFIFFTSMVQARTLHWNPNIHHGQLENGFNYVFYTSTDEKEPFNLRLIVNVGSVDDEQRGMAHVVEHMVFRSNRAHDVDMHGFLDQIGWKTGVQVNAMTRQTETQYMVRTRPDDALNLTQSIKFLSDLAFGAKMKAEDWHVERGVILEEMRQGEGVAERINIVKKQIIRNGSRYVDRPTIGTKASVMAIDAEHIQAFYHTYYVPGNMTLVASGYFNVEQFMRGINTYFGAEAPRTVPNRDYVKLPLKEGLVIGKVQDPMGTTSAVVYGFRSELASAMTELGAYQRLQNYFLRKLMTPMVRAAKTEYDDSISSVLIRFRQPTNDRLVLALGAKTKNHPLGLEVVLNEIERLKQNGIQEKALNRLKEKASATIVRNRQLILKRDFANWEDKLANAVIQGRVEEDDSIRSTRMLKWIDEMTTTSLNARLRELLSTPDQFLFYQIPGGIEQELPTKQAVISLIHRIENKLFTRIVAHPATMNVSEPKQQAPDIQLPSVNAGHVRVLSKHKYRHPQVVQWTLSNGDNVVWLNKKTPDNRLYIKALSSAGYYNNELPPWLAQMALQVWQQSDYKSLSHQDLVRWGQNNHATWVWSQKDAELDLSSIVSRNKLEQLMQTYFITQTDWKVGAMELDALQHNLGESVAVSDRPERQREQLWGTPPGLRPSRQQVMHLTRTQLNDAIKLLKQQPVSMYIVGECDEVTIEHSVLPYLNGITRQQRLNTFKRQLPPGKKTLSLPMYHENKSTVSIKSESSMNWTPEQSFLVSSLKPIVQKALKHKLRNELGGIYSLQFEMTLDKDNVIRMTTAFTTAPERVDELICAFDQVIMNLSHQLKEENYPRIREDIQYAEQQKLSNPTTWLRRLALSYERYQGPDYLLSMMALSRQVNRQQMMALIKEIIPFSKQAVFIGTPKSAQGI